MDEHKGTTDWTQLPGRAEEVPVPSRLELSLARVIDVAAATLKLGDRVRRDPPADAVLTLARQIAGAHAGLIASVATDVDDDLPLRSVHPVITLAQQTSESTGPAALQVLADVAHSIRAALHASRTALPDARLFRHGNAVASVIRLIPQHTPVAGAQGGAPATDGPTPANPASTATPAQWSIVALQMTRSSDSSGSRAELAALLHALHRATVHTGWLDAREEPDRLATLSSGERQTVQLLLTGKSEAAIASMLGRSPHTIHSHVKRVYRKLGVASRAELIVKLMRE
jgi:DNA-binding CsgD family transcriptional regulator